MLRSFIPRQYKRSRIHPLCNRFSISSRRATTVPPLPPPPPPQSSRIERILRRTPRFLRPTLSALHNAPLTHITAFLILHELTAVIPILGLAGAFHYFQWLPPFFAEGKWVVVGVEKFGNYFRRKGWIESGDKKEAMKLVEGGEANAVEEPERGKGLVSKWLRRGDVGTGQVEDRKREKGVVSRWWGRGEVGTRLVVEIATAYAVVKVLLPLRLVVSIWATPWFARWTVVPVNNMIKSWFRRGPKPIGTGTTITGVKSGSTRAVNGEKPTK